MVQCLPEICGGGCLYKAVGNGAHAEKGQCYGNTNLRRVGAVVDSRINV